MLQVLRFMAKDLIHSLNLMPTAEPTPENREKAAIEKAREEGAKAQPVKFGPEYLQLFQKSKIIDTLESPHIAEREDHYFRAQVVKNKAIRIFGKYGGEDFDQVFFMGDKAEYDSYNLSYFGEIVGITDKTVTIQPKGEGKRRLKLGTFIWRNHNFDLSQAMAENMDTSYYI